MDEKEYLRFVQEIIKNNDGEGIKKALAQFAAILDRNSYDRSYVNRLVEMSDLTPEAFELKKFCLNRDLDLNELDQAISRGKARKRREEEEARRGRC